MRTRFLAFAVTLGFGLLSWNVVWAQKDLPKDQTRTPIEHIIVVIQNNHTFDNYFGTYPGVDGIPPDVCMPVDPANPENQDCVRSYHLGNRPLEDLNHSTTTFFRQYNEGRMDGFVHALNLVNQDGGISMGYYDDRDLPYYWNIADEYVLFDRFFSAAHGGSVWNRMYLVAAVPGNTKNRIPKVGFRDIPTIFDRLQEKGISWKFYVNNYNPQMNYRGLWEGDLLSPQVQWVPLLSMDRFIDDPQLSSRIVDLDEYFDDLERGSLPAVSYVLLLGASEHPLSSLEAGQRFTRNMIQALMSSEMWADSAFVITYDDWGGWYDHVPPPQVDEYGYGFRVPTLLVSPYARQGYVDSTELDFTSILKFIEENWGVEPLAERDASANSIASGFDFTNPPRSAKFIPLSRPTPETGTGLRLLVISATYGAAAIIAGVLVLMAFIPRFSLPLKPWHLRRRKESP